MSHMATSTPRSIRFPNDLLGQGEDMAHVLGMSFNKFVVGLLRAAVDSAPTNKAFVQMVEQLVEDDQQILARLTGGGK